MDLVQNLVDEVRWRYKIGSISEINVDTVSEIAEDIYPNYDDTTASISFGGLIFETLMRV